MENKHASYDLAQMQALPLKYKIMMTQQRIKQWYEAWDGKVYVSRSGGKDSDVLGNIVKEMYPDVPQVFVNTGLEYDSVRLHAMSECDTVLKPEMSFVEVITKYGYPIISKSVALKLDRIYHKSDSAYLQFFDGSQRGKSQFDASQYSFMLDAPFRISHRCCDVMKKKPAKLYAKTEKRTPIIGTMASESLLRKKEWIKNGCNAFEKKNPSSNPLSFWTEQDILEYIMLNHLEIASVYGNIVYKDSDGYDYENPMFDGVMPLTTTGAKRTGCVFCMFGITHDTDRFLRLKKEEPKKYDYVMRGGRFDDEGLWIPDKGLGYKFVIDWLNEHGNLNIKY